MMDSLYLSALEVEDSTDALVEEATETTRNSATEDRYRMVGKRADRIRTPGPVNKEDLATETSREEAIESDGETNALTPLEITGLRQLLQVNELLPLFEKPRHDKDARDDGKDSAVEGA